MSDLSADLSGSFAPMTVANDLLKDPPALRRQLDEEGYLFFRGLLPADTILGLRAEITAILARHGAILGGASEAEAIAKAMPFREGEERYFAVYDEIIRLERLYALSHHPALTRMMESALGGSAFPHPLSIVRLIFPDNAEVTTPPHQDYPNNQGSERLTATWIPLGDCPSKMGGLAVLRGSHKFGVMPVSAHLGAGNRQARLPSEMAGLDWVSTDFRTGDVLVFGALTVHAARVNAHAERMRLSVDFRFQPEGDPLTPLCLEPHFKRFSWEEIYGGWSGVAPRYYWREKRFDLVDFDAAVHAIDETEFNKAYKQTNVYNRLRKKRFEKKLRARQEQA